MPALSKLMNPTVVDYFSAKLLRASGRFTDEDVEVFRRRMVRYNSRKRKSRRQTKKPHRG